MLTLAQLLFHVVVGRQFQDATQQCRQARGCDGAAGRHDLIDAGNGYANVQGVPTDTQEATL